MPMIGEAVWWANAWTGNQTYTATWSVDFPPGAIMAKVWPAFYMEYDGGQVGMLGTQIMSIRKRLPSDADQTVPTPDAPAAFDPRMTNVTYGLFIFNCQARIVLDLGFWG
jgi:hypothetical protein